MHVRTRTILVIALGAVVVACMGAFAWFMSALRPVGGESATQDFVIAKGDSVEEVGQNLKSAGLLRNPFAFRIYVAFERQQKGIQAGTYALAPTQSSQEILRRFVAGDAASREESITILEGWTTSDIATYLDTEKHLFPAADFLVAATVTDSRTILPDVTYEFFRGKPETAPLEGFLFPDTYKVFRDAKPADVIRKMLDAFAEKVYATLETDIHASDRTLFENVTLASIIEREVVSDSDRRNAADVFLKRLRDGIALQSDVTVAFATGKKTTLLTSQDIEIDSPYNTYTHTGLPVGPIGNPSMSAIRAVFNPESNPYYYFLTKPESGEAVFSTTYAEHLANKAKYLGN